MLDYIALNKPILCFSKSASVTGKMIEEKGIGHAIDIDSIEDKLNEVINLEFSHNQKEMHKLQDQYNLKKLATSWIALIQDINEE